MNKELQFIICCIEECENAKNMTGKDIINLFKKYHLYEYIKDFYEVLYVTGPK